MNASWPPGVDDFQSPIIWTYKPLIQLGVAIVLVLVVWLVAASRLKVRPTKGQWFMEFVYDFVRNSVAREMIGPGYQRWVPLLVGMFSIVIVNNWFGEFFFFMFPTFSRVGFVYGMVIFIYILYIFAGFQAHGAGYLKKALVPPGVPAFMLPIVVPMEFISTFITRPITLSIRLFANMFAGHLVVLVFVAGGTILLTYTGNAFYNVSGVLSWVMGLVMMALEVFIGFLQAYIFTMLTAQYISSAVSEEH